MKKKIVLIAIILVSVILLAACSGAAVIKKPEPDPEKQMVSVEGNCEAVLSGTTLTVSGTVNLMDGTNGIISVMNSNGTVAEEIDFTKNGDVISNDFTVTDEWEDIVYGFITFDTNNAEKQPKEVTEAYGKNFENLEGSAENVIWDTKGVIAVFGSQEVKVR